MRPVSLAIIPGYHWPWLTTGKSLGDLQMYGDDNLLNRSEALRLWTINGAASTGESALEGIS